MAAAATATESRTGALLLVLVLVLAVTPCAGRRKIKLNSTGACTLSLPGKFRRPFALLGSLKRMLAGRNCITHAIETPAGGIRVADNWSLPVRFLILSAQFELELELEKAASPMQRCQADD
jgi:hypothetical protein